MADITGTPGDDTLIGTIDDDVIVGLEGDDTINGLQGDDQLRGDEDDDTIDGGDDHDFLAGGDGNDQLFGGSGDDFLRGDLGDDLLDGGSGINRVSYAIGAVGGVTVSLLLQGANQNTGSAGIDTLFNIHHLSGTIFDDILIGDGGDNWIWGGSNNIGVTGDDTISAGGGNDLVTVGIGDHDLDGGADTDTLSFFGAENDISAAGVTVSLLLQGAAQDTEQGLMILGEFENLSGSNFDDELTGDDGDNLLAGDSGADTLLGGRGNDVLLGDGRIGVDSHGAGTSGPIIRVDDVGIAAFPSPVGHDVLDGGRGDDTLNGGGGDDELTGGQGLDTFVFGASSGDDTVTDFANGLDHIALQGIAGVDDFSDLTIIRYRSGSLISWGDGSNTIFVEHVRPAELDAGDFLFI